MSLNEDLLSLLVCPKDKGTLEYHEEEQILVNPRLNIAYPIEDGIPVLLVDQATPYQG
ncbi:Trm112 family protein [Corynebacterium kroppenstedtii]|uniref:Trm112 family protein n=1 Tax=Corynebacterium sp. PCR 32 TaxID=3351342 RepID=UPI0030AA6D57